MYVVNERYPIEIYIQPGKFKMSTENSFINYKELLNEKVSNEHVKESTNIGISNKKEKGVFTEKLMKYLKLDDDIKKSFYLIETNF